MKVKDWNVAGTMLAAVMDMWNLCRDEIKKLGVGPEILGWLQDKKGCEVLKKAVGFVVEEYQKTLKVSNLLRTDFSLSLKEMIKLGQYGWVQSDITSSNFLLEGKGKEEVECKLFHFNYSISLEQALVGMKEQGYELAKIHHLLSFGAQNPEEQKSYPIIALGSFVNLGGRWSVPGIDFDDGSRLLRLYYRDDGWSVRCRFLGVRKIQNSGY